MFYVDVFESFIHLDTLVSSTYHSYQVSNGLVTFQVTAHRDIENDLTSVDPHFVDCRNRYYGLWPCVG